MNVIDGLLVALVVGLVALEAKRGFGRAVYDFVALLLTVRGVPLLVPHVAGVVHLAPDAPANQAAWFGILFVVFGTILLFIGNLAYESTLITLDTLDPFLGGVLGLGVAVIVGHAIVNSLALAAHTNGAPPEILANSRLGMEFYHFVTYHEVIDFLSSLGR